jgi:hypothetical protein
LVWGSPFWFGDPGIVSWIPISKCRADAQRHGDENTKLFSKCRHMHRDMEMKTENCFQNADYADAQPWTLEKQYADAIPPQCPHRLK